VISYCLSDVAETVAVHLRTQLVRSEFILAEYVEAAEALLGGIERECAHAAEDRSGPISSPGAPRKRRCCCDEGGVMSARCPEGRRATHGVDYGENRTM
jgi:hypothetical protein